MNTIITSDIKRYCICGLPISSLSENKLIEIMNQACILKQQIVINTPNLNFLRTSDEDINFREAITNSDILIPDGMPIIWIARILNIPIRDRLAGSTLISKLISEITEYSFKVFYFGGDPGVSRRAHRITNVAKKNTISVGYLDPGFGDIETLSKEENFKKINLANTNILLVSLPAIKGVRWIEKNKKLINSNIIISSGTTVNFIAGKIKRAPLYIQNIGLEWFWRIFFEPRLIKRYFLDGTWLTIMLCTKILPLLFVNLFFKVFLRTQTTNSELLSNSQNDTKTITLPKICDSEVCEKVKSSILNTDDISCIKIDVSNILMLDSRFLGELIFIKSELKRRDIDFELVNHTTISKIFIWLYGAEKILLR